MTARVLSGMRPTGDLHLGHWCGVLSNWRRLQEEADCFFFVADWHALTTDYAAPDDYAAAAEAMVVTWLAAGIDGQRAALFIQSRIPEHAELHVLLSMLCPLPKLMQLPTYKEQKENMVQDLDTYGFLGYPLLQSADILAYRADYVPVGEDQRPHVEFTREIARRVNRLYGGGEEFQRQVKALLAAMPAASRAVITDGCRRYHQDGDEASLADALAAVDSLFAEEHLTAATRSLLRGYCLYDAKEILPPPQVQLTPAARLPGTDGRKMSKSYNNTIALFDDAPTVEKKIARMQTDPARQRRSDKGDPQKCPVWSLHEQFSDSDSRQWVQEGCVSAAIGCVECKKRLATHINEQLQPLRDRRGDIEKSGEAAAVLEDGCRRARAVAESTLEDVRAAMRLPARPRSPAPAAEANYR